MAQRTWVNKPNSLGLFFGLVLTIASTAAVQGQDVTVKDLRGSGREAFKNGKYEDAVPSLRMALEQGITSHASDTMIVVALNDLAEALRLIGQYEESKKLFDRAIDILRTSGTAESRYKPIILCNKGKLYLQTGNYALSESLFKEALHLAERDLDRQYTQVADVLGFLGMLYTETHRWKQQRQTSKEASLLQRHDWARRSRGPRLH